MSTSTNIVYFSATGAEMTSFGMAYAEIADDHKINIHARTRQQLFDEVRIEEFIEKSLGSDLVFIMLHGGEDSCPALAPLTSIIKDKKKRGEKVPYVHIHPNGGDPTSLITCEEHSTEYNSQNWVQLYRLSETGGVPNLKNLILSINSLALGEEPERYTVQPVLQQGIYHPNLDHVPEVNEYFKKHVDPDKPVVGIWFYQKYWVNNNLEHLDMVIREIEKQGASAVAVFHSRYSDGTDGCIGADGVVKQFFMDGDKARIDVLLNAMTFSLNLIKPEWEGLLEKLDVPLMQTMVSSNPYEDWKESMQGVSIMDVIFNAAQPEFDGALINVNSGCREHDHFDPLTGGVVVKNKGIPDRVEKLVSLSLNWARLRKKPNSEKKVAIVFHHYPPRNDRIGCAAGLDSFASVKNLIDRMKEEGYTIDRTYDDGDHMSREILDRMTYDKRWLTPDALSERSEAYAERETYMPWHEALPEANKKLMLEQWGEMPGDVFTYKDRLNFAGTANGNIFITMQPPRGSLEKAEQQLHDLYLSPTHHYIAKYRWIKYEFGADAVIHVGKHGSLEWLPGKALGLSEECYPDLAIQDLPNIYPYIINDPGEGTSAKRRSYCCIIDHLTPAFTNSGLYEEMAKLDTAVRDYQEAKMQDPSKLPVLQKIVWDAAVEADIDKDIEMTEDQAMADFDAFMEKMHTYLEEITDTLIGDGLHTMGSYPEGEMLVEFAAQLTRLENGKVPSLRESVTEVMGYDYDVLAENRGRSFPGSGVESGGQVIQRVHQKCLHMIAHLERNGFSSDSIPEAMQSVLGKQNGNVEKALLYVAEKLVPNIKASVREIDSTLKALSGKYVEPGPSGAPSRGDADILPTGRNFYSVDPSKIPSKGAWEVGKRLGDALIEKSIAEIGKYPENVAVYIMGTSTMKSKGDSVAEILYLMGARPVWLNGGTVRGVEVIPIEELGRPRFDVTVRSTGFFRDAFPNIIELINDTVKMISALNEPAESNILKKNVYKDIEDYRKQGMSQEEAEREAKFRFFSCPPGTYGAGVKELIETKNWEAQEELGNAYIRYSSHAYGQGAYGEQKPDTFKKVLSRIDATVQNMESREYDMFSCTDFYNYYGGLITAVKTVKGEYPLSVYGDSSDPKRVKVRTTDEEAKHIFRARLLNPKWINGLKRHGYKGAGDLSHMMDVVLGWDATAEVVENHMYDRFADKYALDPEMQQWMKEVNPYALQNIVDKLLEAIGRGMWDASPEREEALKEAYLEIEGEIEDAVNEPQQIRK